jgi:hypothetical protein
VEPRTAPARPAAGAGATLPLAAGWRALIGLAGVANLVGALALVARTAEVIDAWPWDLTRLSVLFLAAMLAAVGAAAVWIGVSGEGGSLPAGFTNLAVTGLGTAGWLAVTEPDLRGLTAAVALLAVGNLVLAVVTHRAVAARDEWAPDLPGVIRWSFVAFATVLAAVGVALIAGIPGVMPWQVGPGTAEVFGWIFLGDAFFFTYPLLWPTADAGRAQLWSFLGYDLVLLGPLAATLPTIDPSLRPNLLAYLAVLVYSTVLGLWYLVVRPLARGTRG